MSVAGSPDPPARPLGLGIEANGINVIDESERRGTPAQLFWPWCAANVSVLAVSYGSFVLAYLLLLGPRGFGGYLVLQAGAVRRRESEQPHSRSAQSDILW